MRPLSFRLTIAAALLSLSLTANAGFLEDFYDSSSGVAQGKKSTGQILSQISS